MDKMLTYYFQSCTAVNFVFSKASCAILAYQCCIVVPLDSNVKV